MSVQLDHAIVPSRDRRAAAELLATLLGVPWAESGVGPFCPVYVNEGLTLDFDQSEGTFPVQHYCFRVSEAEFDGILTRLRTCGIEYRSTPHGPVDRLVNTQHGGRIVYWNEPDGHVWEALTVSYARQPRKEPHRRPNHSARPATAGLARLSVPSADPSIERTSTGRLGQAVGVMKWSSWTRRDQSIEWPNG
jgi:hypothetical protein